VSSVTELWATIGAVAGLMTLQSFWLGRTLDAFKESVDARFEGVYARFDGIDRRFAGIEGRLDRMEATLLRIETRLQDHGERIARLEER
jgi:hypothetical protein